MDLALRETDCPTDRNTAAAPGRSGWRRWVISGGGLGLLTPAPGSWGSVAPAAVFWLLLMAAVAEPWRSLVCAVGALAAGVLTVWLAPWACAHFQKRDPGPVVLDEFCGYWMACLGLPAPAAVLGHPGPAWLMAAGVYFLFRLTDTLKFFPCRQLERLPAGWGILLDDVAAGIQVNVLLQIIFRLVQG